MKNGDGIFANCHPQSQRLSTAVIVSITIMKAKAYLTATELIMDTDGKMMIFAAGQKGEPMSDLISNTEVFETYAEILEGLYEIKNWKCGGDAKMHAVIEAAIKALEAIEALPSSQPDRCDTCRFVHYPKETNNDQ